MLSIVGFYSRLLYRGASLFSFYAQPEDGYFSQPKHEAVIGLSK
jgi:hypothetical protein